MTRASTLLILLAATSPLTLTPGPAFAAEEFHPFTSQSVAQVAADRFIIRLRPEVGAGAAAKPSETGRRAAERVRRLGDRTGFEATALRSLGGEVQVVHLRPVAAAASLDSALARLREDPEVDFVEPDALVFPHRLPNDPGLPQQWYLLASVPGGDGATVSAADAVAAWDETTGTPGVVVAVIDSGVRFEHPDLGRAEAGGKLLPGYDFVSPEARGTTRRANDGDGWDPDASDPGDWVSSQDLDEPGFDDCSVSGSSWHGTRVSGMLAGLTDNGAGIAGLGWSNRILPVRALGKCGGLSSDIIAAMRWAAGLPQPGAPVNPTPAQVLNLSLGGEGACSNAYQSAIDEIAARGVLIVVSAGNDGSEVDRPANCRGVVSVTGVRHVGTKVGFANLGTDVTIAAPGGNCVNVGAGQPCLYSLDTTTNFGATTPGASGYTDRLEDFNVGTSFAAPIVSGVAALMLSVNAGLDPDRLRTRMSASATPFPSNGAVPACHVPLGPDDQQLSECNCTTSTCGAGIAHAGRAVREALRPIAVMTAPKAVDAGATVHLSGLASRGADGRVVVGHEWTLVAGATALVSTSGAETAFVAPGSSSDVVVRLTVTDDLGRVDSTDTRIAVAGGAPTTDPPSASGQPPQTSSGGGGGGGAWGLSGALLLLFAGAARLRRARRRDSGHGAT